MVILTSFNRSSYYPLARHFSVARFQPYGFNVEELRFLSATDKSGRKMLLRNYANPLEDYKAALKEAYKARWFNIGKWLQKLNPEKSIALLCWCPYSTSTRIQQKEFGSFACHTGLIGRMINVARPDIKVFMDQDRCDNLVEKWRPINFELKNSDQ